jgi:hypothetical protein
MSTLLEQKSYSWRKIVHSSYKSLPFQPYPLEARRHPTLLPHTPPPARCPRSDSPARVECVPPPLAGGGWGAGVKKTGAGVVRGNSKRLAASAPKSSSSAQAGDPCGGTAGLRGRGWWAPAYAGATTFFIAPPFLPLRYHPPRTKVVILRPYQQEKTGDPCDARARKGGDSVLDLRPPFSKNTEMTTVWGG